MKVISMRFSERLTERFSKRSSCLKRTLLLCLILPLLLSAGAAQAEQAVFLPGVTANTSPMELTVSVQLNEHRPFDTVRTGWLNDLLRHITLTVRSQNLEDESWSQMSLQVDDEEVIGVTELVGPGKSQAQVSVLPNILYTRTSEEGTALDALLGSNISAETLFGFDGTETDWRDDGEALLYAIQDACAEDMTNKAYRETISGFTTVARRKILTIDAEGAEDFRQTLMTLCPDGDLQALLSRLTFSGKQSLKLYTTEEGSIVQAEYTGRMGVDDDHMRQVSITWKMLRKDYLVKDNLSIKSPTVSGKDSTDYDTITYTRRLEEEDSTATLVSSLNYKRRLDKRITTWTAETDLTRTPGDSAMQVAGTVTLGYDPPYDDNAETAILTLDLTVPTGPLTLSGTVNYQQKYDGKKQEDADLTIRLAPCAGFTFALSGQETVLDELQAEELAALQETLSKKASAALVRPLVLLPREETYFFSYELPDENWQQIVDAAQSAAP